MKESWCKRGKKGLCRKSRKNLQTWQTRLGWIWTEGHKCGFGLLFIRTLCTTSRKKNCSRNTGQAQEHLHVKILNKKVVFKETIVFLVDGRRFAIIRAPKMISTRSSRSWWVLRWRLKKKTRHYYFFSSLPPSYNHMVTTLMYGKKNIKMDKVNVALLLRKILKTNKEKS